ncbi:MAG TPA: hypothetical protein VMX15_00665 [Candidatus Heimdallarchaeota archaeon]|nr:hypothetical protein [Candidatus Heimdallarchaeota archaeon]
MPQKALPINEVAKQSGTALKLYTVLTDRALKLGRMRFRVRRTTLAKRLGHSQVRGISRALTVLVKANWITRSVRTYQKDAGGFVSAMIISLPRLREQLRQMCVLSTTRELKRPKRMTVVEEILAERRQR